MRSILSMFLVSLSSYAAASQSISMNAHLSVGRGKMVDVGGGKMVCRLAGVGADVALTFDMIEDESGDAVGHWQQAWSLGALTGKFIVILRKFSAPNPRMDIIVRIADSTGKRLADTTIASLAVDRPAFSAFTVRGPLNENPDCPDSVSFFLPAR